MCLSSSWTISCGVINEGMVGMDEKKRPPVKAAAQFYSVRRVQAG
jgi:hypothetical protein